MTDPDADVFDALDDDSPTLRMSRDAFTEPTPVAGPVDETDDPLSSRRTSRVEEP